MRLASVLPAKDVALGLIQELDEDRWYLHTSSVPTCRSIVGHCVLIEAADLSYPIILDASGRVMDGMHRVCKALMQGALSIKSVQFSRDPEPDFVGYDPESLPYDDE